MEWKGNVKLEPHLNYQIIIKGIAPSPPPFLLMFFYTYDIRLTNLCLFRETRNVLLRIDICLAHVSNPIVSWATAFTLQCPTMCIAAVLKSHFYKGYIQLRTDLGSNTQLIHDVKKFSHAGCPNLKPHK